MGYSPWGHKESGMTERLSTEQHILLDVERTLEFKRITRHLSTFCCHKYLFNTLYVPIIVPRIGLQY